MPLDLPAILVRLNLRKERGFRKLLVHVNDDERDLVTYAAQTLGVSQQIFMRTVLVNASEQVLKEVGGSK